MTVVLSEPTRFRHLMQPVCDHERMKLTDPASRPAFELKPIGVVRSGPYVEQGDAPRQGRFAPNEIFEIEIYEAFRAGLGELARASHIHVLLWFDRANRESLVAHPPYLGGQSMPVFWTRSPNRPNPIGLDTCEVLGISDGIITVSGMDALRGTPVLDIKPYIPSLDCLPDAHDMLRE